METDPMIVGTMGTIDHIYNCSYESNVCGRRDTCSTAGLLLLQCFSCIIKSYSYCTDIVWISYRRFDDHLPHGCVRSSQKKQKRRKE